MRIWGLTVSVYPCFHIRSVCCNLGLAGMSSKAGLAHSPLYEKDDDKAQSEAVFPANRQDLYEKYGYSAAVRSDNLLFVSGQVGSRPDGSPEPDFEAQVRLAFANLEATLAAGGCTFDDIVDVTTFHTDPEKQFGVYRTVKREKFPKAPYPNATAVGVNWLACFDFEIKVIARIPSPA